MMLNEDYKDMLHALRDAEAKFLVVGAYALAAHGVPRATIDIDIWIEPSNANACLVMQALEAFGAPLHDLTLDDLQRHDTVFQIGVAPRRIDIITGVSGLEFSAAFANSQEVNVDGVFVRILSREDFITNKRASGRTKDLADLEALGEA